MRALLFDTRTGHPVIDLESDAWDYDTGILASDKLSVTVPAYTKRARTMDLRALLARGKHSVALVDESVEGVKRVTASGPIVTATPQEDPDGRNTYKVECQGVERMLEGRHIRLFPGWPLIGVDGKPTGLYDQVLNGLSYGTIMKRLIEESEKFPGGDLPIVYEADRAGVHERTAYAAVDGKQVREAMDQLADLADGVEFDFQPEVDEFDRVTYRLVTGTDSGRIISGPSTPVWNLGGANPDMRGFERRPPVAPVVTDAIFAGGKDEDRVLLARAQDHTPIAAGYPRTEVWDSSHSTVSVQTTLQSWADSALGSMADRISFQVKARLARNLRHGDIGQLAAQGHWDLPDGEYPARVLSVGRTSADPDWVSVSLI